MYNVSWVVERLTTIYSKHVKCSSNGDHENLTRVSRSEYRKGPLATMMMLIFGCQTTATNKQHYRTRTLSAAVANDNSLGQPTLLLVNHDTMTTRSTLVTDGNRPWLLPCCSTAIYRLTDDDDMTTSFHQINNKQPTNEAYR
jgi:hypothetical protein